MMASTGSWGDIIDDAEAERFVGRGQELDIMSNEILLSRPHYLIFYIMGQGGVGKTTLLNHFRKIVQDEGFLLTDSDEQQRNVPTILGRFANQLAAQGYPMKRFDERYKVYRQKMDEIENDPRAPQGLAAMLGRTVIRATYVVGDVVPGLRKGLEFLPRESLETQVSEWTEYLAKKLSSKDEVALVREPVSILTPLFFDDLNEIAQKRKLLLCFENFEATRQELQDWLLRLREYNPSQNIRIAIAGRDQPGEHWDRLHRVTMVMRLEVFSEQEAEVFLDLYGVMDIKRRKEILEWSNRLPVLMSWLASPEGDEPDILVPTHSIVERYLRWVTEPELRQVALLAAIPRTFNVEILKLLFDNDSQSIDVLRAFDWLLTMPFVFQHLEGWRYHDVVRRMMLHYQRLKTPQTYRQMHTVLSDYYVTKYQEMSTSDGERWSNERWRKGTIAYIYHFITANPTKNWGEVMSMFALAMRKRRSFSIEIIDLLSQEDVYDELSSEQNSEVNLFSQKLSDIENVGLQAGFDMFDKLCGISDLSSQAKGYGLAYRGESHRLKEKLGMALGDFTNALHFLSEDAWTYARRGETYQQMERYEEALVDFDQAIALDEKYALVRYCRAQIHLVTDNENSFESDIKTAIKLAQMDLNDASSAEYWRIGFNLAFYDLVYGNIGDAKLQYDQLASACVLISALQGAENDLKVLLSIQPTNELAQNVRAKLLIRITDLAHNF